MDAWGIVKGKMGRYGFPVVVYTRAGRLQCVDGRYWVGVLTLEPRTGDYNGRKSLWIDLRLSGAMLNADDGAEP